MASQTKSKQRVADHGEVFTAEREVKAMCDLVKQETERIESRFLEPACGNGNFLAEVLSRKLAVVKSRYGKSPADYEKYSVLAVTSIYGVELLPDNAAECRSRLFALWNEAYTANNRQVADDQCREAVRFILEEKHPLRRRADTPAGGRQPHHLCRMEPRHREPDQAPGLYAGRASERSRRADDPGHGGLGVRRGSAGVHPGPHPGISADGLQEGAGL